MGGEEEKTKMRRLEKSETDMGVIRKSDGRKYEDEKTRKE